MHSFHTSFFSFSRRGIALLLAAALATPVLPCPSALADGAGQLGALGTSNSVNALGSQASALAGKTSIATGNGNVKDGQSTQNQMQMAMGAMQIAMGLLGLLAAAAAADKADQAGNDASKMNDLSSPAVASAPTTTPPSTPVNVGSSSTGSGDSSASTVDISAAGIHSGTLGAALAALQQQYGIPPDQFVNALKSGVDPKDLLNHAPKNPVSMDNLNKISEGLAANNIAGKEAAERILASAGNLDGAGSPANAVENGKGVKGPSASNSDYEDSSTSVSPEVKAAMAAKAEQLKREQELQDMHGWSIFQLVHNRYQKLETMIYGRVERTNPNPTSPVKE